MKKIVYFTIITNFLLASCAYDEYYSEGRVKTISATEITNQSAVLNGNIKVVTEGSEAQLEILGRGFRYGTSSNDLNQTVSDKVSGEGNFSCNVKGLLPNTKYYARACAVVSSASSEDRKEYIPPTYYGNTIEFTTEDGEITPPPPPPPTVDYVELTAAGIAVQKTDITTGAINWTSATTLCENSIVGGYTDWRLPTLGELATVYTVHINNPNLIGGFKTGTAYYWSSTPATTNGDYSQIYFYNGSISSDYSSNSSYNYARCVRSLP